jgi:rare lipoprotein A
MMLIAIGLLCMMSITQVSAQEPSISRKDGFLLIWQSISRPIAKVREKQFSDLSLASREDQTILYAKARGLLEDEEKFSPDAPLTLADALLWIFRTRNVEPIDSGGLRLQSNTAEREHLKDLAELYDISFVNESKKLTRDELLNLMRSIDSSLAKEQHEVSLYSEKFHGKGGAFGEQFNMYDLTAAHRTFPHNTLVKVTNLRNGKSVVVRINDRGPYVKGRDMDLSLHAFLQIEDRSKGVMDATFERLGDSTVISGCLDTRSQKRITKSVVLTSGVPHRLPLGKTLTLSSIQPFVLRDIVYPDGGSAGMQTWVTRGEDFTFTPSVTGLYRFLIGSKDGHVREMRMEVVECGGR